MHRPTRAAVSLAAFYVAIVVAFAWAASFVPAFAGDVVVTTTGKRYEGRIVSEDDAKVVLEEISAPGAPPALLTIPKCLVASVERASPAPPPAPPPSPASRPASQPASQPAAMPAPSPAPAPGVDPSPAPIAPPGGAPAKGSQRVDREEWWLLEGDARIAGTRHLVVSAVPAVPGGLPSGFRFEELVVLFPAASRVPGVRVQRIEETDGDFVPRDLFYREVGEAGPLDSGIRAYETIRSGPVEGGVWSFVERVGGAERRRTLPAPRGVRCPLGAREAILRAAPRAIGLHDIDVLDPKTAATRRVRAGFSSVSAAGVPGGGADVLRWEDSEGAREARIAGMTAPREDAATGLVAVATTEEQARAATEGTAAPVGEAKRDVTLAECGVAFTLPGASWTAQVAPPRPSAEGRRVAATFSSRLLAADVRVEWDPTGVATEPAPRDVPEKPLLERLRAISPDVQATGRRAPVDGTAGAWRIDLEATVRGERVGTLVLVAEKGTARVVVLATAPSSAWADARGALDAILRSFRWL